MHTAGLTLTAEGPPTFREGDTTPMRVNLKRVLASLGTLAFLLLAAGSEWKI